MYINSGYLHNSLLDFKDKSKPLVVGSCGTYRLIHQPKLPTYRPRGRIDYQLLYIAAGKGHFYLNGKEEIIEAGHMILYKPREMQRYVYYGADTFDVGIDGMEDKCKDMFIMGQTRQKFTGFILPVIM